MSLFSFIGDIFKPAADLVDELHVSEEEMGILKNKLAEIEAKVAVRVLDLQSQIVEANSKVAISEQEHGNMLSKSWRPVVSIIMSGLLVAMGLGAIPFNQFLAGIAGGFLGIYTGARSYEKK